MSNEVKITRETKVQEFAEVVINGVSQGKRPINGGPSLKEFATALAREHGIRTFTVTVDMEPVTESRAAAPVPSGSRVAVQAKDSRGSAAPVPDASEEFEELEAGDAEEHEAEQPATGDPDPA